MASITISINNRPFTIACEAGQEQRVSDLGAYIDKRVQDIARAGAASNESQLMVLTSLVLADEIFEIQDQLSRTANRECVSPQEIENFKSQQYQREANIAYSIVEIAEEIEGIAKRLQNI